MKEAELFAEALEREPGDRDTFLRDACGEDTALRERVNALLAAHEADDGLLDASLALFGETITGSEPPEGEHEPPSVVEEQNEHGNQVVTFGDYELQGEIARGAMGVVYRAEQQSLKRTVALKMIRSTLLTSEQEMARFRAEAEAAASLDHPNIVPIYEVGEHQGQHYYTMKLIEGGTLRDHLERLKQDPKMAARMMSTIAGAVHAAHQRGILHRDLKPGNILVDETGEPHVTDFGLAKQMESVSSMTLTGQIMGTPQYMAPEQANSGGSKELTTAADVYALGAMFYEMLCGHPPHEGDSLMEILRRVVDEEAAPPSRHHPKVQRDLETIAMKCLEKDPAKRYASAEGLESDLDRWLEGEPIQARPVGAPEQVLKWIRRKPVHATAWGLAALFLLTLGIGGPVAAFRQIALTKDAEREMHRAMAAEVLAAERLAEATAALKEAESVSVFLSDILKSPRPEIAGGGRNVKVADLLDKAIERLDKAENISPDRIAELRRDIAVTCTSLALHEQAITLREQIAQHYLDTRGPDHPAALGTKMDVGISYQEMGRYEEALKIHAQVYESCRRALGPQDLITLQSMGNLAISCERLDQHAKALKLREEAYQACEAKFGRNHSETYFSMTNLARSYFRAGRKEEALALREVALPLSHTLFPGNHPQRLGAKQALAQSYQGVDRLDEAIRMQEEVLKKQIEIRGRKHVNTHYAMQVLAKSYDLVGRGEEARALRQELRRLQAEVAAE